MARFNSFRAALVSYIATLSLLFPANAHAKSFLPADVTWTGLRQRSNGSHPDLTELLSLRNADQDPIFDKAMRVIDGLATRSTCHHAAAAQLLITCKASEKALVENEARHELLERAKSVYGVRVAVCETGEGKARVPSACRPLLEIPRRLALEVDVISSKALAACLQQLMAEHFYWTSYSNNRQDATTLCQAVTLEAARLEAIRSYEKLAELLPDFHDILRSAQAQWVSFLQQQQDDAHSLGIAQQKNQAEADLQRQHDLGVFRNALKMAHDGMNKMARSVHNSVAKTEADLNHTHETIGHILGDFATLTDLLSQAMGKVSRQSAENEAAHALRFQKVHDLAVATTESLQHLRPGHLVQEMNSLFDQVTADLIELAGAQKLQLDKTMHHLQLSGELTEAQRIHLALEHQSREHSVALASKLDCVDAAARRVSSRIEQVSQVLTHVEHASSLLGTLAAGVMVPYQLATQLHLRLLALVVAAAIVLFIWKSHQSSYSLLASYVFLESALSLFSEYSHTPGAFLSHVANHIRTIRAKDNNSGSPQVGFLILGTAAVLCSCALCIFARKQAASRRAAKLPRNAVTYLDLPHQKHDLNFRLRYDQSFRVPDDRYRRAATVC